MLPYIPLATGTLKLYLCLKVEVYCIYCIHQIMQSIRVMHQPLKAIPPSTEALILQMQEVVDTFSETYVSYLPYKYLASL